MIPDTLTTSLRRAGGASRVCGVMSGSGVSVTFGDKLG
jgi:hypothetical protein